VFSVSLDKLDIARNVLKPGEISRFAQQQLTNQNQRLTKQALSGRGADNQQIRSGYSPGYRRTRERAGRKTSPVDLHFTGQMMGSKQVTGGRNGARLAFTGSRSRRGSRGRGRTARNSEIARFLVQRGFRGFHEFGRVDLQRIERAWSALLGRGLRDAIKVRRE